MAWVLNLIYIALLLGFAPWLAYQSLTRQKYRRGWSAKLLGLVPERPGSDTSPCLWFHAVSVGEVNLLAPVLRELQARRPDWTLVVSTTTDAGYALARTKYPELAVFYCPLDFSWSVRRAMRRLRPTLLVLSELELWPNLIAAARRSGARVALINGRLSEHSFRGYRRLGPVYRRVLSQLDWLGVQNATYAERFRRLGVEAHKLCITGSIKYDGVETNRRNPHTERLRQLAGFADDDVVFLAGSTQAPEEAYALAAYESLVEEFPRLRLVLVPRHPERFAEVARWLERRGTPFELRSRLAGPATHPTPRVLLVDTVGELGWWWGTAEIAFVGGSFGSREGQNMIEPAAYGAAVSFGPRTRNFRDVVAALLEHDAACVVHDDEQLAAFVRRCLVEPDWAAQLGRRAQHFVQSQLGAARQTAEQLIDLCQGASAQRNAQDEQSRFAA